MSDSSERTWGSFLEPFVHNTFRKLWIANLVSTFGSLIQMTGAAWMMTTISASTNMVALVQASTTLPIMLFSLASGAIADNYHRRHVMLAANIFMLVVSAVLTAFAWLGAITPWQLLGFTFLVGCGTALNNPAWQASVSDVVPRLVIPSAVTLNSVGFNLSRSIAPALGGIIIASAGVVAAFAANALSYVGLIVVLFRWKPPIPTKTLPREGITTAMAAGLRYVAMSPNLGKVLFRAFVFGIAAIALLALLPLVARDRLGGGPSDYGMMLGAFGLGGIFGAVVIGRLEALLSIEATIRWAFGVSALGAWIAAISTNRWLTSAGLFLAGASWVLALSRFNVTVQLSAPRWVLGRALALYQTAAFAGFAVGSWIWGMVAERYDTETALIAAGVALLVGGATGIRYPLPEQASLNLDPLNRWQEPSLALDLTSCSGPIVITVEFLIADADVPEFLSAMNERRRIRLRDGARKWTLMRDLQKPERWVMSYQFPTWVEYVRHNQRTTQADALVGERITALHRGTEPPRVQRLIERQTDGSSPNVEF